MQFPWNWKSEVLDSCRTKACGVGQLNASGVRHCQKLCTTNINVFLMVNFHEFPLLAKCYIELEELSLSAVSLSSSNADS